MRYHITLRVSYEYDGTAAAGRHLLRLMPATIEGVQRLIIGRLDVSPRPDEEEQGQDFFGNATHSLAYRRPHEEIDIALAAHVQRLEPELTFNLAVPLDQLAGELAQHRGVGPHSPLHFLGPSPRVVPVPPLRSFAQEVVRPGMTALEATEALTFALHRHMTFDAEATDVETSPLEAFRQRRGVCQDYAHILIGCLRSIGIPAGYVSGFLRTLPPPGQPRLDGADAMHAWVRAWCGAEVGWREFDPTNAIAVTSDHIVVAYGRDYSDVAPVKGVSRMTGGQEGRHTVDVIPEAADA